jgi:signal transduction histidine kinase
MTRPLLHPFVRRVTVRTKVVAGVLAILLAGTASLLVIQRALGTLREGMQELVYVKEPASAAGYEMEINTKGIAFGVLKYLEAADSRYRRLVEDNQSDFERFHARYLLLSDSREQVELGDSIGIAYREFRDLANLLMDQKDRQEPLIAAFGEGFERIDQIIDTEMQMQVERSGADGFRKVELLTDLEADIAEVAFWVANYQRDPRPEYRELIFVNDSEFSGNLAAFRRLNLTAAEQRGAAEIDDIHDQMMTATRRIMDSDDLLRQQVQRLVALQGEMDHILDDRIQVLALNSLAEPGENAEADVHEVLGMVRLLIPVFVLSAAIVAFLIIIGVTGPLRKLKHGTEAVRGGDLSYRINAAEGDEFSDLARHFDDMVAKLQTTTVSKELLEGSEKRLQQTVAELRREIRERMEAEHEQARLQVSLRRSETMSAMGALVAGVAHEVRNPLFGVSSTLDAMEARFGEREEYGRYMQVLRGEIERLNDLMRGLLEYGNPSEQILSPTSMAEVVRQALSACDSMTEHADVEITTCVPDDLAQVLMQPSRMVQVFRNLIENALQHTPPGGSIRVEAGVVADNGRHWVECVVQDSGPGVEPEDRTRIFEPFFSRRRNGTGLGLSIVHRIVEEHGGQVAAASGSNGGGLFTVRLPMAESAFPAPADSPAA